MVPTVKHGGGSVLMWGCMSAAGVGELHFIDGIMNSQTYCSTFTFSHLAVAFIQSDLQLGST